MLLKPWDERGSGLTAAAIIQKLNQRLAGLPEAQAFAFSPPAIPGIGTAGGVTFMLEDRSGQGTDFLAQNMDRFLQAARQRPDDDHRAGPVGAAHSLGSEPEGGRDARGERRLGGV